MNGLSPRRGIALSSLLLPLLLAACAGGRAARVPEAPPAAATVSVADTAPADAADGGLAPETGAAPAGAAIPLPAQDGAEASRPAAQPATSADPATAPTQAELDYAALYGNGYGQDQTYDPVADPTLPTPAELPTAYDPWEPLNRKVHAFNNAVDRTVAKPLAKAYVAVVPRPVRLGVRNFFNNLGQPVSMVNALLQGRPKQAGQTLARFAVNTTVGVAGIFDPATRMSLPSRNEDFGQTLGVWGWKQSRYVELPLFGPRTVRDVFGLVGDAPLAPLQYVEEDKVRVFAQGLQLVDVRTQLMAVDSMREGAADEYALVRDAWLQRRNYQINEDRRRDDELPEYLQDDVDPYVPVDVMPVVPGAPTGGG
jgi:phospholipid-binding lipoprotein MlaA